MEELCFNQRVVLLLWLFSFLNSGWIIADEFLMEPLFSFFFFRLEKDKSFSQIPPMSFVAPRQAVKRCFPLLIKLELKV